jgi:LysR family transcriptional regulator, carnitine catabolism transcriptional activator
MTQRRAEVLGRAGGGAGRGRGQGNGSCVAAGIACADVPGVGTLCGMDGMEVSVEQLRIFAAVAQTGSLTAAGDRLGLAQSSVSRAVSDIERRLGAPVFERGGRGVKLTAVGEEFVRVTGHLLESWDNEWDRFRNFLAGSSGTVSIACLASLTTEYLAPVIRRFRHNFPDVVIRLQDGFADAVLDRVSNGLAEFGITSHPPVRPPLKAERLFSDRMYVIVPREHPLAQQEQVSWAEISHENIITLEHGSSTRPLVELGFRSIKAEMKPALEAQQLVTLGGLVAAGLGVCPLPGSAIPFVRFVPVAAIPLIEPVIRRDISVLYRVDRLMQPAAKEFLDELRKTARARRRRGDPPAARTPQSTP